MNRQFDSTPPDLPIVLRILQMRYGNAFDPAGLESLATQILPYVQRGWRQETLLEELVEKIVTNYQRDGRRVLHLLQEPFSPAWDAVLEQVLDFAARHSLYPKDTEATSWPDLDAYNDIRGKLESYNFEGSLDHWITVTVVNRLRRYWRDRKALSAGGPGFRRRADRESDDAESGVEPPRWASLSLDQLSASGSLLLNACDQEGLSVARDVEDSELRRVTSEAVRTLAARKHDDLLPLIWYAVVEQGWRLREVADIFDLTISQVYRRIEHMRLYLQQHPDLQEWLYAAD